MTSWIIRVFRSIQSRSYKSNHSTWYLSATDVSNAHDTISPLQFTVLDGRQKEQLHQWLVNNKDLYPWVYFPDEIKSSNQFDHWYPAIFNNESLVAWIKLARKKVFIHDFGASIELSDDIAFIYDTFVDPEYRGQHLGKAMIEQTKVFLASKGYKAVACHIEDWNKPSIKIFKTTGFKPIGHIRFVRFLFFRFLIVDGRFARLSKLPYWLEHKKPDVLIDSA